MITPVRPAPAPAKWTLLLYSAGDNDQKEYNVLNVTELETVGSDAHMHLVAQVDTGATCSRYHLERVAQPDPTRIQSPALETSGPVDMAAPRTLADFVSWGMKNYPAEHTMVIVADHGSGWQGACEDDSHGTWMDMPSMRQAFEQAQAETGRKIDVIGFDCCLMASTEVAHELKDVCDFVVGSQDYEDSAGWPYTRIFTPSLVQAMRSMNASFVDVGAREMAAACVREAATRPDVLPTMTAIDTAKVGALTESVNQLGQAILAHPESAPAVGRAADAAWPFDAFHDLGDFSARIGAEETVDPAIREAAAGVSTSLGQAIVAEQHDPRHAGAHGLTIEASTKGVPEGYADTRFARETCWPRVLEQLKTQP